MENIYPPENYRASEPITLNEYFEEFSELVQETSQLDEDKKTGSEDEHVRRIFEKMGCELKLCDIKRLSNVCNPEHLTCPDENLRLPTKIPTKITPKTKIDYTHPITDSAKKLEVVKARLNSDIDVSFLESFVGFKRSFQSGEKEQANVHPDMVPGSDFLLLVLIYKPKRYFPLKSNQSAKLNFGHSIEILGRNSLINLRDTIVCASDSGLSVEVNSPHDDLSDLLNAKDKYPSGFFFIENVFYNDFRHPLAVDNSQVILNWAKAKGIGVKVTRSMEGVNLNDLKIRLGYPYLYMHQGDCEHVIVFSDAKLLQKTDDLCSSSYPRISQTSKSSNHQQCYLCSLKTADWVVQGSTRLPQERTFLCTECCNNYNYIDGKKIDNFKLYPHFYEPV